MRLTGAQVRRFYAIWQPLLTFVNQQRQLLPDLDVWDDHHPLTPEKAKVLRERIWADDDLRNAFVERNPPRLNDADLDVVRSWQHRVASDFFILKHLKKHSVFHGNQNRFYGVVGLNSPIEELAPFLPHYVHAVLLPFEGWIIYDSILVGRNIVFGRNMTREFNRQYQDARRRGEVVTRLGMG